MSNQNQRLDKNVQTSFINLTMDYLNKNSYLIGLKKEITNHRKNNFLKHNPTRTKISSSISNLGKNTKQDDVHDIYNSPLPKIYSSVIIQESNSKIYSLQKREEPLQETKLIDQNYLFLGFNIGTVLGQSNVPTGRQSHRYQSAQQKFEKNQIKKRKKHNDQNRNKAKSLTKMEMNNTQSIQQFKRNLTISGKQLFKIIPIKIDRSVPFSSSQFSSRTKHSSIQKRRQRGSKNYILGEIISVYQKFTKQLQTIYKQEGLLNRLGQISKGYNRDTIRIYKQDFSKIYTVRYGKDKLTSFFDFEYIEDFQSLNKMMNTIIHLSSNQILLLSFLILDHDSDGVISHSDIFSIISLVQGNQLIKQDLYRLIKYVKAQCQNHNSISDECDYDYLKKQNFTLSKYRFMIYMQQKNPTSKSKQKKSHIKISRNYQKHLFTLKKQENYDKKNFDFLKQFLATFSKKHQEDSTQYKTFRVNFTRFKTIFNNIIPCVFIDALYVLAGIQMNHQNYQNLNINVLEKPKKIVKFQQISKYEKTMKIYSHLKQNYHFPYVKNQNLGLKIKTVL